MMVLHDRTTAYLAEEGAASTATSSNVPFYSVFQYFVLYVVSDGRSNINYLLFVFKYVCKYHTLYLVHTGTVATITMFVLGAKKAKPEV